jgi:Domain of unknown function (DUF6249)
MNEAQMALSIPIFLIVLGMTVAIVAIVTSHRQKQQRAELRHRERLAALDKGIELPPDPAEYMPARERKGGLMMGLSNLFVGIVLYFALYAVADPDVALFGLIPAAIGAASLIAWLVERREKKGATEANN